MHDTRVILKDIHVLSRDEKFKRGDPPIAFSEIVTITTIRLLWIVINITLKFNYHYTLSD